MPNPNLSVEIVLDKIAGELSFELLTTYSALGASNAADVKGTLYFQGPTGDIYINSKNIQFDFGTEGIWASRSS